MDEGGNVTSSVVVDSAGNGTAGMAAHDGVSCNTQVRITAKFLIRWSGKGPSIKYVRIGRGECMK